MSGKCFFLILVFVFFSEPQFAQSVAKPQRKILKKAEKAFEREDFLNAYNNYTEYLKTDTGNYNAIYKSGLCLFNIDKTDTLALSYFQGSKIFVHAAHFYLGRIYQMQGKSEKALGEFYFYNSGKKPAEISDSLLNDCIKKCEEALLSESQKEFLNVKNLGPGINTSFPEYVPLLFDNKMFFTSRRPGSTGGALDPYGKYYEDVYVSEMINRAWTTPKPLDGKVNTQTHDACVALSPDGRELIFYRTDETLLAGDLYVTTWQNDEWTSPVKLGDEINSEYLETSACFSSNGNEIIFSSNRPGGIGGRDLYRVVRFLNGKYSLPVNLGPSINTEQDEDGPFVDPDNNALYFSSKGHTNMGEYDIFKAEFDAEKNAWKNVMNMGQPVNSANDDIYFFRQKNSSIGYFTSRRAGGFGDADIYEVDFSKSTMIIAYCRLEMPGSESLADLSGVNISLTDLKTGKLVGSYQPNRDYANLILLAVKDHPYQVKIVSDSHQTLTKDVTFNDSNKEVILSLTKQP